MIALLGPILVFLLFLGLIRTLARGQSGWVLWAKATVVLAACRLGVLWFLLLLHWRGALGLWAVPLILVLLPEGMLLPRKYVWTSSGVLHRARAGGDWLHPVGRSGAGRTEPVSAEERSLMHNAPACR